MTGPIAAAGGRPSNVALSFLTRLLDENERAF